MQYLLLLVSLAGLILFNWGFIIGIFKRTKSFNEYATHLSNSGWAWKVDKEIKRKVGGFILIALGLILTFVLV